LNVLFTATHYLSYSHKIVATHGLFIVNDSNCNCVRVLSKGTRNITFVGLLIIAYNAELEN